MSVLAAQDLVSIEEYLKGELVSEQKHEYLGGIVHAMAGGSTRHNTISVNALVTLANKLAGSACRPFNSDMKIKLTLQNQIRFYYPDVHVTCQPTENHETYQDQPCVIVEVLNPSTQRIDQGEKREAYLAIPSLQTLILLDQDRIYAHVDQRSSPLGFERCFYQAAEDEIPLPSLDTSITLGDLYQGAL